MYKDRTNNPCGIIDSILLEAFPMSIVCVFPPYFQLHLNFAYVVKYVYNDQKPRSEGTIQRTNLELFIYLWIFPSSLHFHKIT